MPQSADPIADVLRAVPGASDEVRASAWDAFQESADPDEFAAKVKPLALPDEVKAALWDAKAAQRGPQLNFAVVNKQPVPVEDPNTFGTVARHAWAQNNPLTMYRAVKQALPLPQALGGAGVLEGPLSTVKGLGAAQEVPLRRAQDAYAKGDTLGAAIHGLNYLIPVVGPVLDEAGTRFREGKWAAGLGDTLGLGAATMLVPKVVPPALDAVRRVPAVVRNAPATLRALPATLREAAVTRAFPSRLNPVEAAAVTYGEQVGVPLDVATRTGSPTARAMQKRVANSLGGEGTAERLITQQEQALSRTAEDLKAQADVDPATPLTAGEAMRSGTEDLIRAFAGEQATAYDALRAIEADPANVRRVQTHPVGSRAYQDLFQKLQEGAAGHLTRDELYVMRQIEAELDSSHYQRGKLVRDSYEVSDSHYAQGQANAPVYHDIRQAAPGTADITGAQMRGAIAKTLETGQWTDASRGALAVARQRLQRAGGITKIGGPTLAADVPILGTAADVALPVDLRGAKQALAPIYQDLLEQSQHVQFMGKKAEAFLALRKLMTGPDVAPVSVVDGVLGDLKAAARGAKMPELRTAGQGVFAKTVEQVHTAIDDAIAHLPNAKTALDTGRSATKGKWTTAEVLDEIKASPVSAFDQMVAPRDTGLPFLQRVREVAPQTLPKVARAYLEQLFDTATAEGGFERAAALQAQWQRLGDQTKLALFGAEQTQALDNFFLLAKRIAENPNPSGTATTLNATNVLSTVWTWPLAKVLYAPRGAQALTQALRTATKVYPSARVAQAAQRAAFAQVAAVARDAKIPLPQAAQAEEKTAVPGDTGKPQSRVEPSGPVPPGETATLTRGVQFPSLLPTAPPRTSNAPLPNPEAHMSLMARVRVNPLDAAVSALRGFVVGGGEGDRVAQASELLAAALPLLAGPKALKAALVAERTAAREGAEATRGIRAYHGSPHDFEKFSLEKIGTGEGAQAYGHGLYFAENEATAKAYRDDLGKVVASFGGQPTKTAAEDMAHSVMSRMKPGSTTEDAMRMVDEWADAGVFRGKNEGQSVLDVKRAIADNFGKPLDKTTQGRMYEVNIHADPAHFLDWDAPLSQQAPGIREAWEAAYRRRYGRTPQLSRDISGAEAVEMLGAGDRTIGSQALRERGIPGIKYLDQGSRMTAGVNKFGDNWFIKGSSTPYPTEAAARIAAEAAGNVTRNFVVFDDALIDVLKKYGLSAAAIGLLQRRLNVPPAGSAAGGRARDQQ